jgi:predicted short-subunit dehydrogenase-like oxidoreductase (DUF2520 family)
MSKPAVTLIGAGSAGTAMTVALHRAGYPITAIASRSLKSAQRCAALVDCKNAGTDLAAACRAADIIVIATIDSAIETTCQTIAASAGFRPGQLVLHLSGALTSDTLITASEAGADTLSMHPAQTLVQPSQGADLLKTAWFCLEGNDSAIARGREIANAISGKITVIDKDKKVLYHAALSIASNYLTTIEAIAVDLLAKAGIPRQNALPLLMPLIQGSVDTLADCDLPNALTGSISRGDVKTIEKHLRAMEAGSEAQLQIYKLLGLETLKIARAKGKMAPGSDELILKLLSSDASS